MVGGGAKEDGAQAVKWQQFGGKVSETTNANGRLTRTFLAPTGEKLRSWKECMRHMEAAAAVTSSEINLKAATNGEHHPSNGAKHMEAATVKCSERDLKPATNGNHNPSNVAEENCGTSSEGEKDQGYKNTSKTNSGTSKPKGCHLTKHQKKASGSSDSERKRSWENGKCDDDFAVKNKKSKTSDSEGDEFQSKEKAASHARTRPKRANAATNFKEKTYEIEDAYVIPKEERVTTHEQEALFLTARGEAEDRRLSDFVVHDDEGNVQPLEVVGNLDIYISGVVVPKTGILDKVNSVRCDAFGPLISWSIEGYDKGVASITLSTALADYSCMKPAGTYKNFYNLMYEKAIVCVEVYRALNPAIGGDADLGLSDLYARVSRALIGKPTAVGQFFSRDYFFAQGEFIATQLKELDVEADDDDQLFSGLPVLEALEECAKRTHEVSFIGSQKPGVLSIQEGNNGHPSGVNQVGAEEQDAMDADEKLARHLQEYEDRTVARRMQPKGKVYVKINEDEIAADYPLPAHYKPEESEMDEYLLHEDNNALLAPEDLPHRKLYDWTLYNADFRLISLELLPMLAGAETDVEIFGSGMMMEEDDSSFCVDDGTATQSAAVSGLSAGQLLAGSENRIIHKDVGVPEGMRIFLSAIKEWVIEFGADMVFVSIRTDGAWYRLGKPSRQYAPWYAPVLKTARLAIKVITMLKDEQRVSRLSFTDVVKRLAEKLSDEGSFNSKLAEVERYVVVHGQIILQQFAEYPDETIRRSQFVTGLMSKMEQKHHTKLVFSKKKLIKKGRNSNPRALQPDAKKQKPMRATTTQLVNRIWSEYYAKFSQTGEGLNGFNSENGLKDMVAVQEEAEEVEVEVEVEDESEEEDDSPLINISQKATQRIKASKKMQKEFKWSEKAVGKTSVNEPVYAQATFGGEIISVGGAVLVNDEEDPEQLPAILLVEYLYQAKDGLRMLHGRVLQRGSETILGNVASEYEVFLTEQCAEVEIEGVRSVVVKLKRHPWGHPHRKANAAADQSERELAKERARKGLPAEYFCSALYASDKGAFFSLPKSGLAVGDGTCEACQLRDQEEEKNATCMLPDNKGFRLKGIEYLEGDFLYLDPSIFPVLQNKEDLELAKPIFKGGRNKGLRPFAICQLLSVQGPKKKNGIPSLLNVQRFYRPDDFGPHKGYIADIHEVYYSEEKAVVDFSAVRGRCEVLRPTPVLDTAVKAATPHLYFCSCFCDPNNGTVKQLPANVKLSTHTRLANGGSAAAELAAKAKGKGKAVENDNSAEVTHSVDHHHDDCLATLDIFAGCGGLSEGLRQAGISVAKWAIEYEYPAAVAFKLNHPNAEVFQENCNVILRCIMERGGDLNDCLSTPEAGEMALNISDEKKQALPKPGEVDFINGGPPCQGFSGMNRFNTGAWSKVQCEMILAFLSYTDYFRPRYFLLENVRNFVSFNKGQTFRLTLATLLEMGYQVRFGVLQAGNYGVSQSRKRAFIWAAAPDEILPEWPEPMHVFATSQLKIGLPGGLSYSAVPDAGQGAPLRAITVKDTIYDLPPVENGASTEEIKYGDPPVSWFQKQIRGQEMILRDHISKEMNELNLERCKRIPKCPGADWRSLPDEKVKLSSGQLVDLIPWCLPNTADRHNQWKGLYGRLDWEGNFPTSVTDPQPMGKVGMCFHPEQDRIVTVRECARSQGFPDSFKFSGNIQSRHRQIGNAVPPPLARALGLKLKEAIQRKKRN